MGRQACAGNEALRVRVEALLRHQTELGEFMEMPVFNLGGAMPPGGLDDPDPGGGSWPAGTRVGDYVIGSLLGEGGMGEV